MKFAAIVTLIFAVAALSAPAHANKIDFMGITHLEMTLVNSIEETSPEKIDGKVIFQEFKIRPLEFVEPATGIQLLDIPSDVNKKSVIDFNVKAGTPYFKVIPRKSDAHVYCTVQKTAKHRHTKKDKTQSLETCLVDSEQDGTFDKIYMVNRIKRLSIHAIAPININSGTPIEPISYSKAQPDPSAMLTAIIGYHPDKKANVGTIFSAISKTGTDLKTDRSKLAIYLIGEDNFETRPYINKEWQHSLKKIESYPVTLEFEIATIELANNENGELTFKVKDGLNLGDIIRVEQAIH